MKKSSHSGSFWTSYSDLMTSMFFIMLALFVLVIAIMHNRMKATEYKLKAIENVINSTKELEDKDSLWNYKSEYKKYVLNVKCYFDPNKTEFEDLKTDTAKLHLAGEKLKIFLNKHKQNQYLLIIEGQASRNDLSLTDKNYDYSYHRALTLMKFWKKRCEINFGYNCEIQIAGSGDGRYNFGYTGNNDVHEKEFQKQDALLMRDKRNEVLNQRFVINLIPKNIVEEEQKAKQ